MSAYLASSPVPNSFRIAIGTTSRHLISLAAPFGDPAIRACQNAQRLIVDAPELGVGRECASDAGELDAGGCLSMVGGGKQYRAELFAGADGKEVNGMVMDW